MALQNLPGLELIEGQQIRQLADKANVKYQYVWQIMKGKRDTKSIKAKAIYSAAKALNESIKQGLSKAERKLQPITDND